MPYHNNRDKNVVIRKYEEGAKEIMAQRLRLCVVLAEDLHVAYKDL